MTLFLAFWLLGWACGEVFAVTQVFSGQSPFGASIFLFAWLGVWTVGGLAAGYAWVWTTFGFERVVLRPGALVEKREVFGLGREREYDLAHVSNLRLAQMTYQPFDFAQSLQFWGLRGGSVAFDYGPRSLRFGVGLDEAEAQHIVERFKTRHVFG